MGTVETYQTYKLARKDLKKNRERSNFYHQQNHWRY